MVDRETEARQCAEVERHLLKKKTYKRMEKVGTSNGSSDAL